MAYTPQTWADGPGGGTPITAARLNHMEDGISNADTVTWTEITGKPAVIGAGSDAAAARSAIGAGTSSLALGSTSSTAAAGNHTHTLAAVTDAGDAAGLDVGTAAGTVAAGDHTHAGLTADAAAGTASVRTLGTGAQQAAAGNHTHSTYVPTSRTVNGQALSGNVTLDGGDVLATGYAIGTAAAVAASDTLLAAIGKLEARIVALETP